MKKLMPLIGLLALIFIGYWMFTDPTRLADVTRQVASNGWDALTQLFNGVISFIDALSN